MGVLNHLESIRLRRFVSAVTSAHAMKMRWAERYLVTNRGERGKCERGKGEVGVREMGREGRAKRERSGAWGEAKRERGRRERVWVGGVEWRGGEREWVVIGGAARKSACEAG